MSNRGKLTIALLSVVALLIGCWLAWNTSPEQKRVVAISESAIARMDELRTEATDTAPRTTEQPLGDARSEATPDSIADRSIRIFGRCVDRDHRPVAGARVELTEISWWPRNQEQAKTILGGTLEPKNVLPHAQSAANGTFSIPIELVEESPHGSVVTVVARKNGLCRALARVNGPPHGDLDVGDLVLEPGAHAAGSVHDTLAKPCPNVRIFIWAKGRSTKWSRIGDEVRSVADGSFEFRSAPAALCELIAWADDLREAKLDIDLTNGPQNDIDVVLPELNGTDSISGAVIDPEGHPVKGAWLIENTTSGPEPRINVSTGCDDHGRFRIDGHPNSVFVLTAVDREHRWCGVRRADIASGTHDILLQLDGSKTFVLRVRGDSGDAIERFGYERFSDLWVAQALTNVEDHRSGDATLASDIAPFALDVFAPGWHSTHVGKLDPEHLPSVVPVVLHRACVLRGVVRTEQRTERAWVKAEECKLADDQNATKPARPPADVLTDANGRFEMTVEGTGTVRLRASYRTELSGPTQSINVRPGADVDGLVIEFAPTGSIEGAALRADGSPAAPLSVIATQDGRLIKNVRTDEHGHYRLSGLPSGDYVLVVAFESGWMRLHVHDLAAGQASQSWRARVDAGITTKLELHLLETARCHIALGLPDPPQSPWVVDLSIRQPSGDSDLLEKQIHGNESADIEATDPFVADVEVTCFRSGWPSFRLTKQPVDRGSRDVTISTSTGRIEGVLAAPFAADETVRLQWHELALTAQATATIDAAGRFSFDCAPIGDCTLERSGRPGDARSVSVNSGKVATIDGF